MRPFTTLPLRTQQQIAGQRNPVHTLAWLLAGVGGLLTAPALKCEPDAAAPEPYSEAGTADVGQTLQVLGTASA